MDSGSINRAAVSGAIWVGVAWGLGMVSGASLPLMDLAVDGAIMGASALGSDVVHSATAMQSTAMTSAALTGAYYAIAQRLWRGDKNYLTNFAGAAANDYGVSLALAPAAATE